MPCERCFCGAAFPVLDLDPLAFVYACDFSVTAIALVKAHANYDAKRMCAFVADIAAAAALERFVPRRSVDACTMVFVLSAIAPERMPQVRPRTPVSNSAAFPLTVANQLGINSVLHLPPALSMEARQ
jgi:hypothetical protein